MVGVKPAPSLARGIEAVVRHDRRAVMLALAVVIGLAWLYLWRAAAAMDPAAMAAMPGMADMRGMADMPGMAHAPDAGALALTFLMWAVMMAAMMLPSAAPAILLYGTLVRRHGERGSALPGVGLFAVAYLVVWTVFSAAAALLQVALQDAALMTPQMALASSGLAAVALIAAGVWQVTPWKHACLHKCRHPLEFFMTRWRGGRSGALRMGLEHGAYCVGCCWALMLLLFVAGVMNLAWVALISAFVLVEKLFPSVRHLSGAASAVLIGCGVALLAGIGWPGL